jgi:hypothetical protein
MSDLPNYARMMLDQAHEEGQYYCYQADSMALCFDVLTLFPDCEEAEDLLFELCCDEWLIYDNRNALQQHIDEWDDRPWQQRRRAALSFRFMSHWEGWNREYRKGYKSEREGPPDVRAILDEGKAQLLGAYCLGDEECANYAWPLFAEAIEKTNDLRTTMLWVGKQYAELGFFADAAEMLTDLCSRFNDDDAKRLLTEVRWWRDNAHRLPWLPPAGDGKRYRRMMLLIDPEAYAREAEGWEQIRHDYRERNPERFERPTTLSVAMAQLVESALPAEAVRAGSVLVDWDFLDFDDGKPGPLPEWAKKQLKLFGRNKEIEREIVERAQYSRPIPQPFSPPFRNPNDSPFDPAELEEVDDDEWDFGEDEA